MGQAQVRNEASCQAVPAFQVASYALLLLAALRATGDLLPGPKWQQHTKPERVSAQRLACGEDFVQLSGNDETALGFNAHGGVGCISVTSNVAPKLCAEFQAACTGGDYAEACRLHDRLMPLHDALFCEASPAPTKYAASLLGLCEAEARGEGLALTVTEFLSGTLYNGLGRYEDAMAAVVPSERFYTEGSAIWALTELIEAAVRLGQPERARSAFELVEGTTRAAGTEWALGIEARLRALLSDDDDAEELYKEAITRLGRSTIRVQLARTRTPQPQNRDLSSAP